MVHEASDDPRGRISGPIFADRTQAGQQLAERLQRFRDQSPLILALPRGGVPIGFEVAKKLDAPLDLVLVRKIGVPSRPELAYGAIVDGDEPELVVNEEVEAFLHMPKKFLDDQSARELKEIARRRELYLAGRCRPHVKDRTILIVDDGIATGMTVRVSLKALRRAHPKQLVLAVPVAPAVTIKNLEEDADEIVCLAAPQDFYAISQFYADFHQVSDEEVIALLNQAPTDDKVDQSPPTS